MHFLQVECESLSRPGADPDLQLRGRLNYVMKVGGGGPNPLVRGSEGRSPPEADDIFFFQRLIFLTKLPHKLGKFKLHDERQSVSMQRWEWGTVPLFKHFSPTVGL